MGGQVQQGGRYFFPSRIHPKDERDPTGRTYTRDAYAPFDGFFRPIFAIREIKVEGLTPKSCAAPSAPLIFQPVFRRTARRFSRSWRRISGSVKYSGSGWFTSIRSNEVGSDSFPGRSNFRAPPHAKITARSMTLRNSRILPGQS